ncbi:MAG: zinc-binding dehydrogenase, partial [Candidatus Dormibacteraeota bacterium]|nr:zinc-binding dehydrogenase [Candidatus Dormibacteraeota bacterium]
MVRALRLHEPGDLRLHEESPPTPDTGEVLLRVTAVGLCGSDRHWFMEGGIGDAVLTRPLVLGHEFVGTVASGQRVGERVVADPAISCGCCQPCLEGNEHLCLKSRFAGHGTTDGALRSLMAWPERLLHALPEVIDDREGALLEPLGVALHALDIGQARPGMSASVYGCGPIGLLLIQLLAMIGARTIVATDRLPHRIAAAKAMGATHALKADTAAAMSETHPARARAQVQALIDQLTEGLGVDIAFEAAGDNTAVETAIITVRPGGRIVLVGIPAEDRTCFAASIARRKELTISLSRRMRPTDLPRAIHLAATGRLQLGSLVTDRYELAEG